MVYISVQTTSFILTSLLKCAVYFDGTHFPLSPPACPLNSCLIDWRPLLETAMVHS